MDDSQLLAAAIARMVAAASAPSRIILFGSRAKGTADKESDIDLLVVERVLSNKAEEYMRLADAFGRPLPGVGVDLLLYDESEFLLRSQVPGNVLHKARVEGRILHDGLR